MMMIIMIMIMLILTSWRLPEVVGGADKGGILVRVDQEQTTTCNNSKY